MLKLETKQAIYEQLMQQEIIIKVNNNKPTYFAYVEKDKIRVYNEQVNYFISLEEFTTSYLQGDFYLYEKQQEQLISEEKDEEYYSWWHK